MSLQIQKHKDRVRIPAFLTYVRSQDCECCKVLGIKQTQRTTASHLVSVKWASGSDALAVNQCLNHHPQSSRGAGERLVKYGIEPMELHRKLWLGFLAEVGIYPDGELTQESFEAVCKESGFVKEAFTRRKNR